MNTVNNKLRTLAISVMLLSSLLLFTVTPVSAQAGHKPSVPQFNVKYIDNSYDVPPVTTTGTDAYTGLEYTYTKPGYRVVDRKIEATITNQPFTPYKDENDIEHELYYRIQYKGHFEKEWYPPMFAPGYFKQSDSKYTTMSGIVWSIDYLNAGSQLDFRIEAVIGYTELYYEDKWFPVGSEFIVKETSGWSSTQTITITGETILSSPPPITSDVNDNPPQTPEYTSDVNDIPPQAPEYVIFTHPVFTFGMGALFAVAIIAVIMVILRRHLKTSDINNSNQTNTHIKPS